MVYSSQRVPDTATRYNNQYFDSKTEAMWAVYFDAAGMEWEREPDSFELRQINHNNRVYTPDFYVGTWDSFVEIKNGRYITWQDCDKYRYLAKGVGSAVLVLNGRPDGLYDGYAYAPDGEHKPAFPSEGNFGEDFSFSKSTIFSGNRISNAVLSEYRRLWNAVSSEVYSPVSQESLMAYAQEHRITELRRSHRIIE